jgi:GNAT superfamily N-acetyltransferase
MQVTRTYLQLNHRAQMQPAGAAADFPDLAIARAPRPEPSLYRLCYRAVGEAFHWRDRWDWTDDDIRRHLATPDILLFVATRAQTKKKAQLAGWYELRRVREDDSAEIAYFGIVRAEFGRGLGRYLLTRAVQDAWALNPARVWLHTCTLDHPNALPNYLARGFTPYRTEHYEVDSTT